MSDCVNAFEGMPEIPKRIYEEIEKGFTKYLFFKTVRRGEREYTCTACHETFLCGEKVLKRTETPADRALYHARHNEEAVCPLCGAAATVKNVKTCSPSRLWACGCVAVFLAPSRDDVWFRCIFAERSYSKSLAGYTDSFEVMRYRLTPGQAVFWKKWGRDYPFVLQSTYEEPFAWNHGIYTEKYDYHILRGSELDIDDTFLRYHAYEQTSFWTPMFIRYLCHYARHPQLEMLVKLGHRDTVNELVSMSRENKSILDWTATRPWELYRLPRQIYNEWDKRGCKLHQLKLYKRLKGESVKDLDLAEKLWIMSYYQLQTAYALIAGARKLKADPKEVIRYIEKVQRESGGGCRHCPGITLHEATNLWLDYLSLVEKTGKMKTASAMPKDLKAEHDRLLSIANRKKREQEIKDRLKQEQEIRRRATEEGAELEKKYPKVRGIYEDIAPRYAFADETYTVVVPTSIADLIVEGNLLCHCIAHVERYYRRIETNESYLLFLRKTSAPDTPYYTLEVEPGGTVRQKRTFDDRQNEDIGDATEFLVKWQTEIQKRMTAGDRRLAAKSRKLRDEEFRELRENKVTVRNGFLRGKFLADVLEADLLEVGFEPAETKKTKKKGITA